MKKLLAFTLVAAAITSQAVSFKWDSNNVKISYNGATTLAAAGSITATLIWLGTDTTATIENYAVSNGIEADSVATKSTGMAAGKGTYSKTYDNPIGSTIGTSSSVLAAGNYFTVLLSYKDSDNVTWYNLSDSVYQLPTDAADNTQDLTAHFSHDFTMKAKGTALTAGGGWTAVPEPSTAMLALAGLALLIKRRRA